MIGNIFIFLFRLCVLFGFLFEIPIIGFLTSRRISILVAILFIIYRRKQVRLLFSRVDKRKLGKAFMFFLICLLLVFINSQLSLRISNSSYMEPWHILNLLLYVILFAIYTVVEYKNVKYFVYVYSAAFLIQSIAVFFAAVNDSFRLFLYSHFYSGDDRFERSIEMGTRIMGIALNSSQGSVICSTSIVLLTFAALERTISKWLYYSLCVIFVPMTLFIGRTGVLIEVTVMLFYIYHSGSKKIISNTIIAIITVLICFVIFSQVMSQIDASGYF